MSSQTPIPVHRRVRRLLRRHHRDYTFSSTDHPILKTNTTAESTIARSNDILNETVANESADYISEVQRKIQDETASIQIQNSSTSLRKHITGRQRATIYFSNYPFQIISRVHHCSLATVSSIKRNPLSAIGLSWRQMKFVLQDIQDCNLLTWFSNMNGIDSVIPPPFDFAKRSGRSRKILPFHISLIRYVLTHKADLFLDEILLILNFVDPSLDISIPTLSRMLLKMGFSRKNPTRVISQSDPLERSLYKQAIGRICSSIHQLVFFDESTNSRASFQRLKSRSPAKIQSVGQQPIPSLRVSVLLAISSQGILDLHLTPGVVNRVDVAYFLRYFLLPSMSAFPGPNSILILDNARTHLISDIVEYAWQHHRVIILFLPPYSPDLNPIERVFAYCKCYFKRCIGSYPQLRRTPYFLWLLSLAVASQFLNFENLIQSTYQLSHVPNALNVQIE